MSLGWLRCILLQVVLVSVAVEMSVAQMSKWHFSFVKVSVPVGIFCPALYAAKMLHSLVSECLKVFLF